MAARPTNTMTKIPLSIDATPLARAVECSKRKTMTKNLMTNLMTYIAEALAVVLILLLGVAILSI